MENVYRQLQKRIDLIGPGFPETEQGYELEYLAEMYSSEEAAFAAKMPSGLLSAKEIAEQMDLPEIEALRILNLLCEHNLVIRVVSEDVEKFYMLPSMHGFIDFNINAFTPFVADRFAKHFKESFGAIVFDQEAPIFRILPINRAVIEGEDILPCDDAEQIIRKQDKIVRLDCICRKVGSMKRPCKHNPDNREKCLAFGTFADFYLEHGVGTEISADEAVAHIQKCDTEGNTIEVLNTGDVEVMCSCCGCCCTVLAAAGIFGGRSMKMATNYELIRDESKCIRCGKCADRCNVRAVKKTDDGIVFQTEKCLACGLCVSVIPSQIQVCKYSKAGQH